MKKSLFKRKIISFMLVFCLSAGLINIIPASALSDATEGTPEIPAGSDLVFYDDFSGSTLDSGWGTYGAESTISQKDGYLACELGAAPGENGQTGPQYTIPLSISEAWLGREITISWKAYSDVTRGIRCNLSPGPNVAENNEVNILGNWGVLDNCKLGEWNTYTATKLVEGDMVSADFSFFFKINGETGTVYFDDVLVTITSAAPVIMAEEQLSAVVTVPYEQALTVSGSQPIVWSVIDGSLPAGLELSASGIISGTPSEVTEETFTLEAKNDLGSDTVEIFFAVLETDSSFTLASTFGKELGNGNPLYTQKFGADPWAMEYDGRLYVYMTNDTYEYDGDGNVKDNSYGTIRHINVISSADLVNWTDHGSIPVAGALGVASWANNSWAPCAVWRNEDGKDKFYLYFTNGGGGIGVLTSDSPVGPWTDPNGKALVSHSTPNCSGNLVPWCFDPAVFIDDDGTGYLYFGGGINNDRYADPKSGRVVKLKDNLTEIDGVPEEIAPPYFFEAFAMHKYNGKYYLSYSSNFQSPGASEGVRPGSGNIAYMMSDSPMGPFTYTGEVLANPSAFGFGGGNNHQCIFEFKGEWYIAYHGSLVSLNKTGKGGYRSTHIDRVTYNDDGTMSAAKGTKEGIAQLQNINPYEQVEAETIAWNGGIGTVMEDPDMRETLNLFVTDIQQGDWISVSQADLGESSPLKFTVRAAGKRGGVIELRADSPDPDNSESILMASIEIASGDGTEWQTVTAPISSEVIGTHNLFLVFKGDVNGTDLYDVDWWTLGNTEEASNVEAALEETPADTDKETSNTDDEASEAQAAVSDTQDDNNMFSTILIIIGVVLIIGGVVALIVKKKPNK